MDNRYVKAAQTTNEAKKWLGSRSGAGELKLNRYGNILAYDSTRVVLEKPIQGNLEPIGRLLNLQLLCQRCRMLSSTPPKFGNDCKQASLFYKTNKYFHINKNETGYHKALSLSLTHLRARELCSTTEQMPALVSF
jgi:protein tyrosine phosphatase